MHARASTVLFVLSSRVDEQISPSIVIIVFFEPDSGDGCASRVSGATQMLSLPGVQGIDPVALIRAAELLRCDVYASSSSARALLGTTSLSFQFGFLAPVMVVSLLYFAISSSAIKFLVQKYVAPFAGQSLAHKRNIVTYVHELMVTTALLLWSWFLIYQLVLMRNNQLAYIMQGTTCALLYVSL